MRDAKSAQIKEGLSTKHREPLAVLFEIILEMFFDIGLVEPSLGQALF